MNPKVSVIVPVYGAEAFSADVHLSLRAQTLRDIELIFRLRRQPGSFSGDSAQGGSRWTAEFA